VSSPIPHELLHALAADQIDELTELSHAYAREGDARRAVMAAWAADVKTLQLLLWESGLASAPEPDAQMQAVAEAVDAALRGRSQHQQAAMSEAAGTVRAIVEGARAALSSAFDESVHALLANRWTPLDHLDGLRIPQPGDARRAVSARLDGRTADQLLTDLRTAAADCLAVSKVMAAVGDDKESIRQVTMADIATFEAYLVQTALRVGDTALATVDQRWDIAATRLRIGAREVDPTPDEVRRVLLSVVGPAEEATLSAAFESAGRGAR
jgi:hypothetical protein